MKPSLHMEEFLNESHSLECFDPLESIRDSLKISENKEKDNLKFIYENNDSHDDK